ncbi:hypothetical protein H9660_13175 [Clostridium sp. Sa3CUN1]|uniref:DUF2334 domain-containing protein n=1 Tax=Clostridium gallinarum TaxID=2762246 RepID=A0ABR8Q6P5_9CLOT|nr:hypothetical protein [Clostridium gallinarum]MBD7916100.1 hypothetical protein [Clostridium gallinarum]
MFKKMNYLVVFIIFFIILIPFKDVKSEEKNNLYLILDEMYVIDDLNDIINKIDYLNNKGIPFIISTMSIFNNTNIEAAQRYYEVLRYAESKNGSIILHFPDISESNITNINIEELINKMTVAYKALIDYEVYSVAIDIPERFLKHKNAEEYLSVSKTVFIDRNNMEISSNINFIEKLSYYEYDEEKDYGGNIGIIIPSNIEFNEFKNILESLNKREIYFNDFSYLNTFIKIGEDEIRLKDANLYLNNKNVTVQRFISREEITFISTEEERVEEDSIDLSKLNKALIIITTIATITFIIIAISNRRIDRNKFFK